MHDCLKHTCKCQCSSDIFTLHHSTVVDSFVHQTLLTCILPVTFLVRQTVVETPKLQLMMVLHTLDEYNIPKPEDGKITSLRTQTSKRADVPRRSA